MEKKMKKFGKKEIIQGAKIEKEHKDTIKFIKSYVIKHKKLPQSSKIYKRIAINHLNEDPRYYSKLKKCKL
jgi:hypothetical protein